jgi:primosomal protein N' (replication factor Y)
MIYPPYCDIAQLVVQSTRRTDAENGINQLFSLLKSNVENDFCDVKLNVLGPSVATVPKVNNKYRYRLIIKFRSFARFSDLLDN